MDTAIEYMVWGAFIGMVYLIFGSTSVVAQEYRQATVSWDAVTAREDGEAIPPEELLFYEIRVQDNKGNPAVVYEVSPVRTAYDIQLLANECFKITAFAAATGSPACKPEQQYLLSRPSETVTSCGGGMEPLPPREFM